MTHSHRRPDAEDRQRGRFDSRAEPEDEERPVPAASAPQQKKAARVVEGSPRPQRAPVDARNDDAEMASLRAARDEAEASMKLAFERARVAEERASVLEERASVAERNAAAAEERARVAEERAEDANQRVLAAVDARTKAEDDVRAARAEARDERDAADAAALDAMDEGGAEAAPRPNAPASGARKPGAPVDISGLIVPAPSRRFRLPSLRVIVVLVVVAGGLFYRTRLTDLYVQTVNYPNDLGTRESLARVARFMNGEAATKPPPSPEGFVEYLEKSAPNSKGNAGKDSWGTNLRLDVAPLPYAVRSAGIDKEFDTEDDLVEPLQPPQ